MHEYVKHLNECMHVSRARARAIVIQSDNKNTQCTLAHAEDILFR